MRHLVGVQGITKVHQENSCISVQVIPFFLPADVVEIRRNDEQLVSQMPESPVSILKGKHFFPDFLITDAMDAGMLPVAGGWGIAGKGYGLFYLFQRNRAIEVTHGMAGCRKFGKGGFQMGIILFPGHFHMAFFMNRGREVRQQAVQRLLEIRTEVEFLFSVYFTVSVQDGDGMQKCV